jgi:class 3 adenylate cyclase/tetratricopeptide (TPR) repeat protein
VECLACGATNPEGKRFCGDCGESLGKRCPSCGAEAPAAKRFCGDCGAALGKPLAEPQRPTSPVAPTPSSVLPSAERRQLSVMFCDLVGSTALSARLDPEDLRAVISAYQTAVAEAADRFGGFVAKYLGDGVLVYFGWPRADETDAERAVRAALAIVDAVAHTRSRGATLAVRIGIATGLTVVGDLLGQGAAQEQAVVGETPNLAARLQTAAAPGAVLIDSATRRLIGGYFACRDLGIQILKGLKEPVQAFQVDSETTVESRFAAHHEAVLTPLIGRDEEFDLLLRRWRRACQGEGRVVVLTGEAGIGKSRLIAALEEALAAESHASLRYFCSPHHQDSPLYPVVTRWEQDCGFIRADGAEQRLQKLAGRLEALNATSDERSLIAEMLSLSGLDRYPPLNLTPQRKKERMFDALRRLLANRAQQSPVLMLFEDAHWSDPSTLELMDGLADIVVELPVMFVASCRPEFTAPWIGRANTDALHLSRLDHRQAAMLASHVTAGQVLGPELLARIVAQTDGVPLFIEELTRSVLEGMITGTALTVPATLNASLMARLDRLPAAKQVAQIGAVIGRQFSHTLLAAVAHLTDTALCEGLNQLVASGLASRRGDGAEAVYTFKHALVQDAAYESLLKSRRRTIHAALVDLLDQTQPECPTEFLAHHAARANMTERAIGYYLRAGSIGIRRSANLEAANHFSNALELIESLAGGPKRDADELACRLQLGVPLIATKGYAAADVETNYERARELSQRTGDPKSLFISTRGLWNFVYDRGELEKSLRLANELVDLANHAGQPTNSALALRALGSTHMNLGNFDEALSAYDACLAAVRELPLSAAIESHGESPQIVAQQYRGLVLCVQGDYEEGVRSGEVAVEQARGLRHPITLTFAISILGFIRLLGRDYDGCVADQLEVGRLVREHGFVFWLAHNQIFLGSALVHKGDRGQSLQMVRLGIENWRITGALLHVPTWSSFLADAALQAGDLPVAESAVENGLLLANTNNDKFALAELQRLNAMIVARRGELGQARSILMEAVETARRQGATLYELRALTELGRLGEGLADRSSTKDRLANILGRSAKRAEGLDYRSAVEVLSGL